ncbi:hypothetical protein L1987_24549 [Smallanthus sonchifolius]|uniref:Uncharacterized protein n=1 Tax=Smallanthus sonchifolius TaxID=185202 RepID=A0ACB9IKY1_9ASTR|nr:hypothetical protein L1987_24549 [Smallanthus sonchifolius]
MMRNSPARDIPANSHNDANVPRQKSTGKFTNNNDHHPKEMVDELSFRLRNMSDNNPPTQLDDIDSPTEDDAPQRDSFTSRMFFGGASTSHQMSPLTRSPWASYVERSPTDLSDANSNYTGLMAAETVDVERQQPQGSSSRARSSSGQMFSRMRDLFQLGTFVTAIDDNSPTIICQSLSTAKQVICTISERSPLAMVKMQAIATGNGDVSHFRHCRWRSLR